MSFGEPRYFYLLWVLVAAVLFYIWARKRNKRLLSRFGDEILVARLTANVSLSKKNLKAVLFFTGVFLVISALARPQWGYRWEETETKGIDIMIALDVSKSMLSDDIKPNRLTAAKREIDYLVRSLRGDRIGLVVFAGTSFLQCPPTSDYGAFRIFLEAADTETIPAQGSDIGEGLKTALLSFDKGTEKHRAVILITDGEDHGGKLPEVARMAKEQDIPVYIVGASSLEGAPIPVMDERGDKTYVRDKQGNIVLSVPDRAALAEAALVSGGAYIDITSQTMDIAKIYTDRIAKIEKRTIEDSRRKIYNQKYQIPLFAAFVLLFISGAGVINERKRNI